MSGEKSALYIQDKLSYYAFKMTEKFTHLNLEKYRKYYAVLLL